MRFSKGHGTENDFVLIADPENALALTDAQVSALCDRRAGIGADGVLRVVRAAAFFGDPAYADDAEWFMDYRNADGSVAEMCGNGVRVFAAYLVQEGLASAGRIPIATRAGVKTVTTLGGDTYSVDMGKPVLPGFPPVKVSVGNRSWTATSIDMGNPHVVVEVNHLAEAGPLYEMPTVSPHGAFPHGTNVEFVLSVNDARIEMRVFERGVGETRSCGTGACAAAVAAAVWAGNEEDATYEVGVPGGTLEVTWSASGVTLTGPAVITFSGETALAEEV